MIIFDLDGTLANCEHRRHFIDPAKCCHNIAVNVHYSAGDLHREYYYVDTMKSFKPDWKSFYEACDKDTPIQPVKSVLIQYCHREIEIWSGRCESVRKKTEKWLSENIFDENFKRFTKIKLKMRPIGDSTPDDELKERWLDEYLSLPTMDFGENGIRPKIDFVFESDPKSAEMWRRRGIFMFNCCQHDEEF